MKLTIDEAVVKSNAALLPKCGTYLALVSWLLCDDRRRFWASIRRDENTSPITKPSIRSHHAPRAKFFDKRTTGALMTRTTNDVDAVYESIAWGGIGLLTDGLAILSTIIIMLSMDCASP